MATREEYIASVLDKLPPSTPQRQQIALELHGHIAERLHFGFPLDDVLAQLGDPLKLAESYLSAVPLVPAPLGRRALAKVVDVFAVLVALVPILLSVWRAVPPAFQPVALILGVFAGGAILFAIYTVVAEYEFGQTLGKYLLGLGVVRESGTRISLGQSVVRQLAMFLQIYWIDALFALFTQKRQRAFEMLSRTRTVAAPRARH